MGQATRAAGEALFEEIEAEYENIRRRPLVNPEFVKMSVAWGLEEKQIPRRQSSFADLTPTAAPVTPAKRLRRMNACDFDDA